jgi:hypothetical protein
MRALLQRLAAKSSACADAPTLKNILQLREMWNTYRCRLNSCAFVCVLCTCRMDIGMFHATLNGFADPARSRLGLLTLLVASKAWRCPKRFYRAQNPRFCKSYADGFPNRIVAEAHFAMQEALGLSVRPPSRFCLRACLLLRALANLFMCKEAASISGFLQRISVQLHALTRAYLSCAVQISAHILQLCNTLSCLECT